MVQRILLKETKLLGFNKEKKDVFSGCDCRQHEKLGDNEQEEKNHADENDFETRKSESCFLSHDSVTKVSPVARPPSIFTLARKISIEK